MSSRETNHYTAEFLIRYHKGDLTTAEMHRVEKDAMDDPFLSDALDGYAYADEKMKSADLNSTQNIEVPKKGSSAKIIRKWFTPLSLAASILLLFMIGYFTLEKDDSKSVQAYSSIKPSTINLSKSDSISAVSGNTVANNIGGFTAEEARELASVLKSDQKKGVGKIITKNTIESRGDKYHPVFKPLVMESNLALHAEETNKERFSVISSESSSTAKTETGIDDMLNKDAAIVSGFTSKDENKRKIAADIKNNDGSTDSVLFASAAPSVSAAKMKLPAPVLNNNSNNSNNWASNQALNEVVVTGYPTRRKNKRELASVSKVEAKQLYDNDDRSNDEFNKLPPPAPVTGWDDFKTYFKNNKQTCHKKDGSEYHGNFQVSFYIHSNGKPYQVKSKYLSSECLKELKRLLSAGPQWKGDTTQKVEIQFNW